jgi:Skp family chaperone for outer membrane proteins
MRYVFVALLPLLLAGCQPPKPSAAVIDLDAVASALGRDDVIQQKLQAAAQELQAQLQQIGGDLQKQLQDEQAKLGTAPSEDARKALQERAVDLNRQWQQTQQLAQSKAAQYRNQVIAEFQKEVEPFAREEAQSIGAQVVLTSGVPMLWFDEAIDITDEVIARLRARPADATPAATAPAATAPAAGGDAAGGTPGPAASGAAGAAPAEGAAATEGADGATGAPVPN